VVLNTKLCYAKFTYKSLELNNGRMFSLQMLLQIINYAYLRQNFKGGEGIFLQFYHNKENLSLIPLCIWKSALLNNITVTA
jgi:hypothetical protein